MITVPLFGYAVEIVHVGHQPIFPEDEPTLPLNVRHCLNLEATPFCLTKYLPSTLPVGFSKQF